MINTMHGLEMTEIRRHHFYILKVVQSDSCGVHTLRTAANESKYA